MHVARRLLAIWEVLEPELTEHSVERLRVEWKPPRIAFSPIYGGTFRL
jgi:hypothetical protein